MLILEQNVSGHDDERGLLSVRAGRSLCWRVDGRQICADRRTFALSDFFDTGHC